MWYISPRLVKGGSPRNALLAFPSLVLALAIVASLGPSLINVAIALAIVRIPIYTRLARG